MKSLIFYRPGKIPNKTSTLIHLKGSIDVPITGMNVITHTTYIKIKPMKKCIDLWDETRETICIFWRKITGDAMISDNFRQISENTLTH